MTRLVATSTVPRGSYDEALEWVGRTLGPAPCPTRVDPANVRLFAALTRDDDPRWWRDGWDVGEVDVPPGLLMSYALPPPWQPGEADLRPLWARIPLPGTTLINVSTVTDHPVRLHTGRRLTVRERVESVSPLRQTRLGAGHFVTTTMEFEEDGDLVARHENVMLRYTFADAGHAKPAARAGAPADAVAQATIPVTLELCVLNVASTQDLFPGHYDRGYAQRQRVGGVFLNTMFFHGLADRLALLAAGQGHRVGRREMTMRGSAVEGDTVEASAHRPRGDGDDVVVDVEIRASGRVAATAAVRLVPDGGRG